MAVDSAVLLSGLTELCGAGTLACQLSLTNKYREIELILVDPKRAQYCARHTSKLSNLWISRYKFPKSLPTSPKSNHLKPTGGNYETTH
jgi:hypothetical protein